jgi:hypothetical protein
MPASRREAYGDPKGRRSLLTVVKRGQQMATSKREIAKPKKAVIQRLLDSDPSIRWQVMRDLTLEPDAVVAAEQSRVAVVGWGDRLLSLQEADGNWGAHGFFRAGLPPWKP